MKKLVPKTLSGNENLILTGLFILSVLAFTIYKIYFLALPYFWDESWVYGPALSEMSERIPSLLPGSIDIDLSRGHPMFFHFLGGIWGNIFGNTVTSLHAFALTISLATVSMTCYIVNKLVSKRAAILCVILILVQGIFLAQSAMVLPEVLVSLLAITTLYLWSQGRVIQATVLASICLLSKESGAILLPAMGLGYLANVLLQKKFNWKESFGILGLLAIACLPYLLFLLAQKNKFGWYFYPNHVDLQAKSAIDFQRQLKASIAYTLFAEGRIYLTLLTIIFLSWTQRKSIVFWAWLSFSIIQLVFVFIPLWGTIFNLSIYIILSIASIIMMIKSFQSNYREQDYFLLISGIFAYIYLLFNAFNFFSVRYLLVLVILYVIWNVKLLDKIRINILSSALLLVAIGLLLSHALMDETASDTNQSFINYGRAQLQLTQELEARNKQTAQIFAPFLVAEGLRKRHAGFISTDCTFSRVQYHFNSAESLYNIRSSRTEETISPRHLLGREKLSEKRFDSGSAWFILEEYTKVTEIEN